MPFTRFSRGETRGPSGTRRSGRLASVCGSRSSAHQPWTELFLCFSFKSRSAKVAVELAPHPPPPCSGSAAVSLRACVSSLLAGFGQDGGTCEESLLQDLRPPRSQAVLLGVGCQLSTSKELHGGNVSDGLNISLVLATGATVLKERLDFAVNFTQNASVRRRGRSLSPVVVELI